MSTLSKGALKFTSERARLIGIADIAVRVTGRRQRKWGRSGTNSKVRRTLRTAERSVQQFVSGLSLPEVGSCPQAQIFKIVFRKSNSRHRLPAKDLLMDTGSGVDRTSSIRRHRLRRVHTGACQTSRGHRSSAAKAIPCADLNEVKVCPALAAPERVVLDRRRLAPQDSNRERPVNALKSKLNLGQQLARAADYKANELG